MSREDDGFLTRWSRRKIEVKREAAAQPVAIPPEAGNPAEPEPDVDLSLLPSIEDLTGSSDITMFLQKGVPDALKNAALRKTWASDPAIRDYIGLADFQWDFNAPGAITGYGELAAGTDIAAMMSDITDHHLKQIAGVVEDAAAPDLALAPSEGIAGRAAAPGEARDLPESEPNDAAVTADFPVVSEAQDTVRLEDLAPRRRHGGATPR